MARPGVPCPSGDGTLGADRLRRCAGNEASVLGPPGDEESCRSVEAVRAMPGSVPADLRGIGPPVAPGAFGTGGAGLGVLPSGRD